MEKSRFYQDFRRCVGQARFGAKAQVLGITRGALLPCKLVHTKMCTWKIYTFSRISEEALGNCPASQNFETGGELLLLQGAGFGHDTFVLLLCKLVHSKMRHMEGCHFIWISLGSFPVLEGLKLVWKTAAKEHVFGMTLGVLLLCKLVHSKMRHTWKNVTSTRVSEEALGRQLSCFAKL